MHFCPFSPTLSLGLALWRAQNFAVRREVVFEKAERKVEEYTFFFHQLKLCETQDPNATEFFFNALLNAGKNVVYALCAQVYTCESTCLPCDKAKKKAKQACTDHIKAWKRTRGGFHPTLFDVLQDVRDIETHADRSAVDYLSKTEERRRLRDISAYSKLILY
jgi:hypothetical protein